MDGQKIHVKECYCDIPREKLGYIIREHFVRHTPTPEIMAAVEGPEWREWVALVALLDVPPAQLQPLLEHEDPQKLPHWISCHNYIRQTLFEEGLELRRS